MWNSSLALSSVWQARLLHFDMLRMLSGFIPDIPPGYGKDRTTLVETQV